jgi:hypothetical protein
MSHGRPFEPGNTFGLGRPKGSRNKSTSVGKRLLEEQEKPLHLTNLAKALRGDNGNLLWALKQLMQPKLPTTKLKLGPIKTLADIENAFDMVVNAVAKNKCTDVHGQALCVMLGERRKLIENQELALRVEELEALVKKPGNK